MDDDLSMPPALVDGGLGPSLDHLTKLKLTVLNPEFSQKDIDHLVGVGPGQGELEGGRHWHLHKFKCFIFSPGQRAKAV